MSAARDIPLAGRTLRQHTARGTLVNGAFFVVLSSLGLLRGFAVAAFVTAEDYGIWGIVIIAVGTLIWLKQIGIGDKYIQQDEADQELAFQKAFTLEAAFTAIFMVILAAAVPIAALVYGRPEVLAPGFVLVLVLPAGVLQAPLWVFYREMRFVRQRTLQAVEPIVGTIVAIAMAAAGAGYWALLGGALAGAYAAALMAFLARPYPLRLVWDRGSLRDYVSFSWPLLATAGSGLVLAQLSILLGESHLGLAGAGAIALAATVSQFTDRLDAIVTGTLYPAICAVAQRTDLLYETFVKSNRLALMWAMPFGIGLALFGPDLVHFILGERWRIATPLIQAFGATAAIAHIGFNWDAYFRARGDTRPMAIAAATTLAAFLVTAVPLLYLDGLRGFAIGISCQAAVGLACRAFFLTRLFEDLRFGRYMLRAVAPVVPAAAAIGLLRLAESGHRGAATAAGELVLYAALVIAATVVLERALLREILAYLRPAPVSISSP